MLRKSALEVSRLRLDPPWHGRYGLCVGYQTFTDMKSIPFYVLLLSFALLSTSSGEDEAREAMRHALTHFHWTWVNKVAQPGEKSVEGLTFHHDGTVVNDKYWTAHWEITGAHTLVLTLDNRRAYVVLNGDYTRYVGFDFNGATAVSGDREDRH